MARPDAAEPVGRRREPPWRRRRVQIATRALRLWADRLVPDPALPAAAAGAERVLSGEDASHHSRSRRHGLARRKPVGRRGTDARPGAPRARGAASLRFSPSIPPQSPVAWSNFITGMDAGGHGIFDFIHRDAPTMTPYLSTSRAIESDRALTVGQMASAAGGRLCRAAAPRTSFLGKRSKSAACRPRSSAYRPISRPRAPPASSFPAWARRTSWATTERFVLHVGSLRILGPEHRRGDVYHVEVVDNMVRAQLSDRAHPFLGQGPEKPTADLTIFLDPEQPDPQARRRRRGARAAGRRVERLGARLLRPVSDPAPAGPGPLLSEAGPAAARTST